MAKLFKWQLSKSEIILIEPKANTFWQVLDQWFLFHKIDQGQLQSHLLAGQHNLQLVYTGPQPKQCKIISVNAMNNNREAKQ